MRISGICGYRKKKLGMTTYNFAIIKPAVVLACMIIICQGCTPKDNQRRHEQLKVSYSGDAKIEVGGPFAGVEFHHSSFLAQRISFFYPVANSIDISSDYWTRDTTHIMAAGLKFGARDKEWLGYEQYDTELTPFAVKFHRQDSVKSIMVSYRFAKNKPAMIVCFEITNLTNRSEIVEFDTHLEASLRTCHSFNRKEKAWTEFDPVTSTIYINNIDPETQNNQLFVANAAEQPSHFNTNGPLDRYLLEDSVSWNENEILIPEDNPSNPAVRFLYQRQLKPQEKLIVVHIIGSAPLEQGKEIVQYMLSNYQNEINLYEQSILNKAWNYLNLDLGDPELEHSARWARAILETNAHYLDGEIVPMPCPAEYNFYFTHDALVTDLSAVNFDVERVKRDLDYIIRHAREDTIIPHAYYWKDSLYVTEFADSDNWNNFWMVIASASYLRHSADTAFVQLLYPYLSKCLEVSLLTKQEDQLMWSYRPDWWDIGKNFGPRSYMTILAIKSIREFIYVSSVLGYNLNNMPRYQALADTIQKALIDHLWHDEMNYLMNYYEDRSLDEHYYIGSLLAAHYNILDERRQSLLIQSAKRYLLDENVGIYNAYPMDFANLIDYLKFAGNEAAAPYYYFNGGVWPQGNAWFALALIADDSKQDAYIFIKNTMSLAGIMNGPNGQPAMYEVRNANKYDQAVYGTVDKPQFLWAGAWYLYALYHLFGIREDHWNITLAPFMAENQSKYSFTLAVQGKNITVNVSGKGDIIKSIYFDGNKYSSIVLPHKYQIARDITIELGNPGYPYISSTNSVFLSSDYDQRMKIIRVYLKAFPGHNNVTRVMTPYRIKAVRSDGEDITKINTTKTNTTYTEITISSKHREAMKELYIEFE